MENILRIKERISLVCSKFNKDPRTITIVAVSKGRNAEQIKEAIEAGISNIGENRVKEALLKYQYLLHNIPTQTPIKWHMVGHLQTNKVKEAVKIFDLIHSVDSIRLAAEIDRQAVKANKIQDILVQLNISGENTKFGLNSNDVIEVINEIAKLKNINIKGLMTIAPIAENHEDTRSYFKSLRELMEKINTLRITRDALHILSMGMTDDFEVAIEEGSNMVRLGRAIFD